EPMTVNCGISLMHVEVRGVHHHDLTPSGQGGRRDGSPSLAVVVSPMNEAVVRADPDRGRAQGRGRDGVDDAAARLLRRVGGRGRVEVRRHAWVFAREDGAYLRPALAAVRGLEEELVAEVERVRVGLRDD